MVIWLIDLLTDRFVGGFAPKLLNILIFNSLVIFLFLGSMVKFTLFQTVWFSRPTTYNWYCIILTRLYTTELRISLNHWMVQLCWSLLISLPSLFSCFLPCGYSPTSWGSQPPLRCLLDSALSSPSLVFLPFGCHRNHQPWKSTSERIVWEKDNEG